MIHQNSIIKQLKTYSGSALAINEIFHSIQGEGIFTGRPATFVRFNICHVGCAFCDTKYTWEDIDKNTFMTAEQLMKNLSKECRRLVVLTGGEPLEQKHIDSAVNILLKNDFDVQLETSGIVAISEYLVELSKANSRFYITLSPKGGVHKSFSNACIVDYKMLIDKDTTLKDVIGDMENIRSNNLSLQPIVCEDHTLETQLNTENAIELVAQVDDCYRGLVSVRLSPQIHKFLNLR